MTSGSLPQAAVGHCGPGEIAHVCPGPREVRPWHRRGGVRARPNRREAFAENWRPPDRLFGWLVAARRGGCGLCRDASPRTTEVVEGALERGIAVLCEKPMTVAPPGLAAGFGPPKSTLLVKVDVPLILRLKRWSRS